MAGDRGAAVCVASAFACTAAFVPRRLRIAGPPATNKFRAAMRWSMRRSRFRRPRRPGRRVPRGCRLHARGDRALLGSASRVRRLRGDWELLAKAVRLSRAAEREQGTCTHVASLADRRRRTHGRPAPAPARRPPRDTAVSARCRSRPRCAPTRGRRNAVHLRKVRRIARPAGRGLSGQRRALAGHFRLDDSQSMIPGRDLSSAGRSPSTRASPRAGSRWRLRVTSKARAVCSIRPIGGRSRSSSIA